MSADSCQVMRVLDRCLDTAGPDSSSTVPGVAAAAAKAKTDPDMHQAISLLLVTEGETEIKYAHHIMAVATDAESDHMPSVAELCDLASPAILVLNSCAAASRATGGADRTALVLAGLLLAAIAVERSSLGTGQSRQLRNHTFHGDVAAALTAWRNLSDQPA